MASSTLDAIPKAARIFIDSNVFIYHFTGRSEQCRRLLLRCEEGDVKGLTSVVVLAETTHRLMMIEAAVAGLVSPGNMVAKLRAKPELVHGLRIGQAQIERIPLMGVEVLPLHLSGLLEAARLRQSHGLLTNDSLVAAASIASGAQGLASADADFERVRELKLYRPGDLG